MKIHEMIKKLIFFLGYPVESFIFGFSIFLMKVVFQGAINQDLKWKHLDAFIFISNYYS